MRNKLTLLAILFSLFSNAQTPMLNGGKLPNATSKSWSEIKGIIAIDEDNVFNGFIHKDSLNGKQIYLNVKDFGAVGDGDTDDTQAIQSAIDYANTHSGIVYIPKGEYKVSYQTPIPKEDWGNFHARDFIAPALIVYNNTYLMGESKTETILIVDEDAIADAITNAATRSSYVVEPYLNFAENVRISNMTFDGNRPDETARQEIDILSLDGSSIVSNVIVKNALGDCIDADQGYLTVLNSEIINASRGGVNSNFDEGMLQNVETIIDGCYFENIKDYAVRSRTTHLSVTNSHFYNNAGGDIYVNTNELKHDDEVYRTVNVGGNIFESDITKTRIIRLGSNSVDTYYSIENNLFKGFVTHFFIDTPIGGDLGGKRDVLFSDNTVTDNLLLFNGGSGGGNKYTFRYSGNSFPNGYTFPVSNLGVIIPGINYTGALTGNTFAVTNSTGNTIGFRTILGTDVGINSISNNNFMASFNPSTQTWTERLLSMESIANSIPFRASGGRVSGGTATSDANFVPLLQMNTALAGYQPLDADLTAIAALSGDGLLRQTGLVWGLDTNNYITGNQTITLSGDVTGSGSTTITATIANSAITNAKMANMVENRIKGRLSGTGAPQDLTPAQVAEMIGTTTSVYFILDDFIGGITADGSFNQMLFDNCPIYDDSFINWDITWWSGDEFKTVKTEYASPDTPLRLSKAGGCLSIIGNTENEINIPVTSVLELRYRN